MFFDHHIPFSASIIFRACVTLYKCFMLYSYPACRLKESQDKRNWPNLGQDSKRLRNTGIGG